jgi:DNA-binding IclR family transcriptional regulator
VLENFIDYPQFGCCTSVGDLIADVQAVAVPLGRVHGIDVAALSCTFQGRTLDLHWLRHEVAPQLQAIASEIS